MNIGNASLWQLWKEDHMVSPPLSDGEEYGLVPRELEVRVGLEPIKKRDIGFTSEIRKHGNMVTVVIALPGFSRETHSSPGAPGGNNVSMRKDPRKKNAREATRGRRN
jgi:hypothetical protein